MSNNTNDPVFEGQVTKSVYNFPNRGPWGNPRWRGNTSGHILAPLFWLCQPSFVVDPAEGSGTTGEFCRQHGVEYAGLDLHSGFNLLKDPLRRFLHKSPDFVFFHPPYHDVIVYSGKVWGDGAGHPDDLSRCASPEEFVEKLQMALVNIYDSLKVGGHYAVLIGDQRKAGVYRSYQADVIGMGIGKLRNVVIKSQNNTWSGGKRYANRLLKVEHEYLLLFGKDAKLTGLATIGLSQSTRLSRAFYGTWRNIVEFALRKLGGVASLRELYDAIGIPDGFKNNHIEAKIRQVVQQHFQRVERGVYALAS